MARRAPLPDRHAELVALGVGDNRPSEAAQASLGNDGRAETDEAGDFGLHVAGVEIDVNAVLCDLRLRHLLEEQCKGRVRSGRGPEAHELFVHPCGLPAERGRPEPHDDVVVSAVDDDVVGMEIRTSCRIGHGANGTRTR